MLDNLIVAFIGLGIITLISLIIAFKRNKLVLVLLVPMIASLTSFASFSYDDLMGYPISRTWEQMPNKIKVIFFRLEGDYITLWTIEGGNTRLIRLPFEDGAKETLQPLSGKMAEGKPVTIVKKGKESDSEDEGESSAESIKGWDYEIESIGNVIPGSLPPK